MSLKFQNPANGYIEDCEEHMLCVVFFGPFYFIYKEAWSSAVLSYFFSSVVFYFLIVSGASVWWLIISWFFPCLISEDGLTKTYLRKGWIKLEEEKTVS